MRTLFSTWIMISMLTTGCASLPASIGTGTATSVPAVTAAATPAPTVAARTSVPIATAAVDAQMTATIPPVLAPIRHTPATLMLHRSNLSFDAVRFLKDFIAILKQNQMHVITYRDISDNPDITASEQGKLFMISIDDIYLRYPIDPSVLEMIAVLRGAGYPAVLAVITEGDYAYPATVKTLKELSEAGWEIASHTDRHSNLGEMEKTAPRYVYTEVETSLDKIEKATGVRPQTLVLPEGQMVNDPRFIKRAGIVWIVGINGGTSYDSRKDMVYVGREGPDGDAGETFRVIMGRFNP